ncbi:hypothetical protein BDA99DRAFT_72035 [Phascolomyces articulosus]|uniref:Uncharacterized protein n=1 Tax=Phascolomyces articulosus TaxID=60185 RepID=A0AAD5K002_9FUNG|nr:hypothetical protein BDA99DRAFT_72035 [Phascolomyces articulosus]
MIPLSRVDSDDRPAGLKLARNNTGAAGGGGGGYAFTSTANHTTAENGTGAGSLFDDDLRWLDQNSRASMENNPSRRLDSGRFQHPYVPARSPFRIRDSQNSVTSNTRALSVTGPTHTTTKPFQNTSKWASPMFESEEPRNIMDNRTSLSVEVARMWKRQPPSNNKPQQTDLKKDKVLQEDEGMGGLLGQLLVSQALVDAELYNTLTFEQLSDLKKVRKGKLMLLQRRGKGEDKTLLETRSLTLL